MSYTDRSITIVKPNWHPLVDRWLAEVRGACGFTSRTSLPLPVEQAASTLGIRITTAALSPTLWGLTWNGHEVTVGSHLSKHDRRFALAHELAHIGQARGHVPDGPQVGEWIADWFARELLVPLESLACCPNGTDLVRDRSLLGHLADSFQVSESTVLLQAALLGMAPRIWAHNGRVLCCRCGDRTPLPGCPCVTFPRSTGRNTGFASRNQDQGVRPAVSCRSIQPKGPKSLISAHADVLEPGSASLASHEAVLDGLLSFRPSTGTGADVLDSLHSRLVIRPFRSSDRPEVFSLLSVLPQLYPEGHQWLQRRLADSLRGQASCTVVEDCATHSLCAVAIVTPKSSTSQKLSTFYVAQECRLQGLGTILLGELMKFWQQQALREVYVTVAHHIEPVFQKLIQPAGFSRIAFEENRYGPGRHEAVWKRKWHTSSGTPVFNSPASRRQDL